ncbi:hypothetical protein D3Z45_12190 [Lachnospiraceae bacterium]|nr:hypothetical protein [Lachnospiraceae bacterium]
MEGHGVQDRDFKYILQDAGAIYLGARYSYGELLEEDMVAFKLKTIISHYILKDVDSASTLESHFYYMTQESFSYQTFRELKVKIKVSLPEEKRSLTGKVKHIYKDKIYTLKELAEINLARKKQLGLIIREIVISKLGLMSFTV